MNVKKRMENSIFLPEVGKVLAMGHSATIQANGYSMRPFLENERDKIVLVRAEEVKVGDAVLAKTGWDTYVLHRVISIDGERLTLQGDGNLCAIESCMRADVLGVVSKYVYPDRTVDASDPALRRRIRLWRLLRPVRRYLLFIYKKLILK